MKKIISLIVALQFSFTCFYAQVTGFGAATNNCSSAGNAGTINPATNCLGIGTGSLPTWTTVVNLTGASNSSEGADPTCSGGATGASAIGASSPDVWVRFTTGPTTEGVSFAATGSAYTSGPPATAISGGTTYLAGVAVALYQTNSCPGSGTAPILINRGNGLPGTCDNFGIMSHGSTAGAFSRSLKMDIISMSIQTPLIM
jgi:hypothetical protein